MATVTVIAGRATTVETVRQRPGMYVGGTGHDAVLQLVYEVLGNCIDQHLLGRCSRVSIAVGENGAIEITDDGAGLTAKGGKGVPPLETLLTTHSDRATVDGHRPHVHLAARGIGLFVVNALSESFEIVTVRRGVETRAVCARGVIAKPTRMTKTTRPSGTTVRFRPDRTIFHGARVPRTTLARRIEDLSFLLPELTIDHRAGVLHTANAGLRARLALELDRDITEVAHHRATYKTARGPLGVEVALAWRKGIPGPSVTSWVNLERTVEGSHVDGLLDGAGAAKGTSATRGLIACVSVVMADVTYGSPTKLRLATPEVRGPVAAATMAALGVKPRARRR